MRLAHLPEINILNLWWVVTKYSFILHFILENLDELAENMVFVFHYKDEIGLDTSARLANI